MPGTRDPAAFRRCDRGSFGRRGVAVLLATCALLPGCSASTPPSATTAASSGSIVDVAVPARVSHLQLVDQSGHRLTLASLRGKTVVLADFLTLCQEVCPLTTANLRAVDNRVSRAGLTGRVRLLEVTVDPRRDRPPRLRAYQQLFGSEPNWSFATGSPDQVAALWRWFGVAYERTDEPLGARPRDWLTGHPLTYDVEHQDVVFVIGPDGHERWFMDGMADATGVGGPPPKLQDFLNATGRHNLTAPPTPSWTPTDLEQALSSVTGQSIR